MMNDLEQQNTPKEFMSSSFGDNKADKTNELNDSMTIVETNKDEYSQTIHNIGGNE